MMTSSATPGLVPVFRALRERDHLLIDIRTAQERDLLGFIPSSVSLPMILDWPASLGALEHLLDGTCTLVLVCQCGQRAKALQAQYPLIWNRPVGYMEGGQRAWQDLDLPIAGIEKDKKMPFEVRSSEEAFRALLSCFSAEWIESALDRGDDPSDPRPAFYNCFKAVSMNPRDMDHHLLPQAMSHVAACSWRAGTEMSRIRDNLDAFSAAIDQLKVA